jgi:hypothetical protein
MKKKFLTLLLMTFMYSFSCFAQLSEQVKAEIRANIDWLNGQTGAPTRASTYLHPVPIGFGNYSIRGPLSARSCLNYATIFAFAGETQNAIKWLQAGQDHNQGVQDLFAGNADYCVSYIKNTYRDQAAQSFGIGSSAEWINTAIGEIRKHNPSSANAPNPPAPRRDGADNRHD